MESQQKKSFFKRFWWIWVILLLGGITGFFVYSGEMNLRKQEEQERQKQEQINRESATANLGYVYVDPRMTDEELTKATLALQNGVSIDDPQNDFAVPPSGPIGLDGKTDNPNGYRLGWNDIKKVTFGADQENIYIRYDFYGDIPTTMQTVEGDDIKTLSCNIGISKFITTKGTIDEGLWQVGIMFAAQRGDDSKDESAGYDVITPRIGLTSISSPSQEVDKYGETVYSTSSSEGRISGGTGTDYLIAAFPLANLDVVPESEITFDIGVETNSRTYHHSSIDPLLDFGSAKSGEIITYTLGTSTYTSVKPDYK